MLSFFTRAIDKLKKENRYREFLDISRLCGDFPYALDNKSGKKITVWCSNDYLGMGQNKGAITKAISALQKYGIGSGGTRNISGNNHAVIELEKTVADLHNKDAALSFVSGYVANDATIQTLAKIIPDLIIFSDEKNHASIIAGIRNSRSVKEIFRHNDMPHLEDLLKSYPQNQPKIIIFESVYSMDGDFGEVAKIIELAKKYNALTYIDEVHGVGLYGRIGGGLTQELGLENEIDIIQGTFAKAFGAIGGYIAARHEIIDAVRSFATGFIFTTSLPPVIAIAATANIEHLKNSNIERKKLHENVKFLKSLLSRSGIEFVANQSHIISIKIGDAKKVEEISRKLLGEFGIYVQHINFPTVAKGDERLRITASPLHNEKMMEELVKALYYFLSSP